MRLAEASQSMRTFRTAVSLHSHTQHSRESLEYLPCQAKHIPLFGAYIQTRLDRYQQRTGKTVNFRRSYWTPPVSPEIVLGSEREQIEQLGLTPLVSITDHDNLAAGLSLQPLATAQAPIPVSVEWSVPWCGDCFHLGVHHLPAAQASSIMETLAAWTAHPAPGAEPLRDLFAFLSGFPETLLVLNHPCWDVARVGTAHHHATLRAFLTEHRAWIHALEVNGLRSWKENRASLNLAAEYDLPTVAGGDRHGCRPNTVLNLTSADSWAGFVEEVRRDRHSDILVLPSYEQPIGLRQLEIVGDALRRYPHYPHGRRQFADRTFIDLPGYSVHPLSFYWDRGTPRWLRPILGTFRVLGSAPMRPILRRTVFCRAECDLMVQAD